MQPTRSFVENFQDNIYQKFATKSDNDRVVMFQKAEKIVDNKSTKSTGGIDLGEAFVGIEGLINSNFCTELEFFEHTEISADDFELDYYTEGGVHLVDETEFNTVYTEVYNFIQGEINANPGEEILLVDMEITGLDSINERITISAKGIRVLAPDPLVTIYFTPSNPYYAARGAGICDGTPNPINHGVDAATFINGYANSTASWRNRCQHGITSSWIVPTEVLLTYDQYANPYMNYDPANPSINTWSDVTSHYWKGNDPYECLGNNNTEWQNLFNDIAYLVNYGELRAKAVNNSYEFFRTYYHSHEKTFFPNPYITEGFYHGGAFTYAIITCN